MQVSILLQAVPGQGFRAIEGSLFHLEAEAPTKAEAVDRLRELIERRLEAGDEVVTLEVDPSEHPLARLAGDLKDSPLYDEWVAAMAENRRRRDAEEADW